MLFPPSGACRPLCGARPRWQIALAEAATVVGLKVAPLLCLAARAGGEAVARVDAGATGVRIRLAHTVPVRINPRTSHTDLP